MAMGGLGLGRRRAGDPYPSPGGTGVPAAPGSPVPLCAGLILPSPSATGMLSLAPCRARRSWGTAGERPVPAVTRGSPGHQLCVVLGVSPAKFKGLCGINILGCK